MPPPARAMRASRATLIYDGSCSFCRDAVDRVRRWDRAGAFDYIPFQDAAGVASFGIPQPALAAAMHLVLPDGRTLAGADAAPEILRRLPGKRWWAAAFSVPGVVPVARRVYAWIAARRHCLVWGVDAGSGRGLRSQRGAR